MPVNDYVNFLSVVFNSIPFTLFDYIIILIGLVYIYEDASFGVLSSFFRFVSIFISVFSAFLVYSYLSSAFIFYFGFTKGFSDAISFLGVFSILFLFLTIISILFGKAADGYYINSRIDFFGGAFFGIFSYILISSTALVVIASLPISPGIRQFVSRSKISKAYFRNAQTFEFTIKNLSRNSSPETMNFLTVAPDSKKTVNLNFKIRNAKADHLSEEKMLKVINERRNNHKIDSLVTEESLQMQARAYGKEMLVQGFFSHYSANGFSPFDRFESARIFYTTGAENIAFAQSDENAINGLFLEPGNKSNFLSEDFKNVGIGVLDAFPNGKMYVLEFTD